MVEGGGYITVQHPSEVGAVVQQSKAVSVNFAGSSPRGRNLAGMLSAHPVAAGVVGALAASAILNRLLARRAERRNPPIGGFVNVDGIRLHYVARGGGTPLVLLHGNGSMVQDFQSSGLIDLAAKKFRVIAFDRPGFGHSNRPRNIVWTPQAQAEIIGAALGKMGVERAIVFGHSWGTLVAIALALRYPRNVQALVLASGYYYPTAPC
jgi:hypothetical protein